MSQETNKFFSPITCPSCKNIFYLVLKMGNPEIGDTLTMEQVEGFKNMARAAAQHIEDPEEKKHFLESIDDPAYILDQEELNKITSEI